MTDTEMINAARFSLLPLRVDTLPSEAVLRELQGEPFVIGSVSVWFDGENFAASESRSCKEEKVANVLFETYGELVKEVSG